MKTYRDLLLKLNTLSEEQLDNDIIILNDDKILEKNSFYIEVNNLSLYKFYDTDLQEYFDFEDDEISEEYNCEKVFDPEIPIIVIK
jgi:hypothetical protein